MNEYKEYNENKLAESFLKIMNGTYSNVDALENFINAVIDLTVKDETEREMAKAIISSAKETAEKMYKQNN